MRNSFRYRSRRLNKVLTELGNVIEKCEKLEGREGIKTELRVLYLDPMWELRLDIIDNENDTKKRIFRDNFDGDETY